DAEVVRPLVQALAAYRGYGDYPIALLRERGSPLGDEARLCETGLNVFSVLKNWQGRLPDRTQRYDFVLGTLAGCFPDLCRQLDLVPGAQGVTAQLVG